MTHRNSIIIVLIVFVIIILCCECSWANRIHSRERLRRSHSTEDEEEERCSDLFREISCRREYIQSTAKYILSCDAGIDDHYCARHGNGTFCGALIERYYASNRYYYVSSYYPYPDSNRSCSYSECSIECEMILQQLKDTWGCCFHEMAEQRGLENNRNLKGFTTKNQSHSYWRSCEIQPPEKCYYDINDIPIDPAECTTSEQFGHLLSEALCTPLPQFLIEAKSCAYLYYRTSALCAIKDGKRCRELLHYSRYTNRLYIKAHQDCSRTSDTCSLGCKSTLQLLRDHVGCCLNVYNGTDHDHGLSDSDFLVYIHGLWKSCGIEPPGQCASITTRLQPGRGYHPVGSSSSSVIVFLIIAVFLH